MISRRTRVAAAAAGILLGATSLVACGDDGTGDQPRTVTVVGNGEATGVPDTLAADIGIEAEGSDVSAALNETSTKVTAVTEAVSGLGVEKKDVQTQQVSLQPVYSSALPGGSSQVTGYRASNTVRITIRDIDKASEILSAAVAAGGDNSRLSNVAFSIDDDSQLLKQARETAFNDARSRAEQYASLAGDSLGKVLTIDETTSGQSRPIAGRASDAMSVESVPVEPGEQTLTFTVTVSYSLT